MSFVKLFSNILLFAAVALSGHQVIAQDQPKVENVVVVGGGIGGLTTVYELQKAGVNAVLFEASANVGGRMQTERAWADPTVVAERGAELVNNDNFELIGLMKELGVELSPRTSVIQNEEAVYLFEGRKWTHSEIEVEIFHRNELALKRYNNMLSTMEQGNLGISAAQLLKQVQAESLLINLIDSLMTSELGRSASQLEASMLPEFIKADFKNRTIELLPHADEANRVKGGTDTIIHKLQEKVGQKVTVNHALKSISKNANGLFELKFQTANTIKTVLAKEVVMAMPYYATKNIDIQVPGISKDYLREAQTTGHAKNTKILLRFEGRPWTQYGFTGAGVSQSKYQFWDTTETQQTKSGILTVYTGTVLSSESEKAVQLEHVLGELEALFPGTKEALREVKYAEWKFSYSPAQRPGERYTSEITENLKAEGLYWVGEDKSLKSQGYMNGAVETAITAASHIKKDLNQKQSKQAQPKRTEMIRPVAPEHKSKAPAVRTCRSLGLAG